MTTAQTQTGTPPEPRAPRSMRRASRELLSLGMIGE
jgi:hypothetical protein